MKNQKGDGVLVTILCILSFFALIGVFVTFYIFSQSNHKQVDVEIEKKQIKIMTYATKEEFYKDYEFLTKIDKQLKRRFEVFDKYPLPKLVMEKESVGTALNTLVFFRKQVADPQIQFKGCLKIAHDRLIDNSNNCVTYAANVMSVVSDNESAMSNSKIKANLANLRSEMISQRDTYKLDLSQCMSEGISAEVRNKLYAFDEPFGNNFIDFSGASFVKRPDERIRAVGKKKIEAELLMLSNAKNEALQTQFNGCRKKVNTTFVSYADSHIAYLSAMLSLASQFNDIDSAQNLAQDLEISRASQKQFTLQMQTCLKQKQDTQPVNK